MAGLALAAGLLVRGIALPAPAHAAMDPSAFLAEPSVAAYREGRFAEAVPGLERLAAAHPDDALVRRYLGLALLQTRRYGAAARVLEEAVRIERHGPTYYYLGLAHYGLADFARARPAFEAARALAPESRIADRAGDYLEAMDRLATARTAPPSLARPWSLTVEAGLQFDSNVPPLASGSAGPRESWRAYQSAWGGWDLLQEDGWRLRAEGFAFLGQNFRSVLDDYDLASFDLAVEGSKFFSIGSVPVRPSLRYAFQPVWQGGDRYLFGHAATAAVTVEPVPGAVTQVYYRFASEDYGDDGIDPLRSSRDGGGHTFGITQWVFLEGRRQYLYGGYAYRYNDADGRDFDLRGHRLLAGGSFLMPWDVRVDLRAEWYRHDYPNYTLQPDRRTTGVQLGIGLRREIVDGLAAVLRYAYTYEDSNYSSLTYRRSLVTLGLSYDF